MAGSHVLSAGRYLQVAGVLGRKRFLAAGMGAVPAELQKWVKSSRWR